jgi:hypothetical protein
MRMTIVHVVRVSGPASAGPGSIGGHAAPIFDV